ncbi:sulfotransferase domain-containing protein, partial [Alphaproteobacteria bacterium]|nr:sulfotransferase domain-containing protein [Alphaproteobacteria bacterium]
MNKHIFWISSYPKSGNTLVRAILLGLFFSKDGKISLENIDNIGLFETTRRLNFIKKINKKDFYNLNDLKTLSKYWQKIQTNQELEIKKGFGFLKTHSCLVSVKNNFFTSENITKGFIYVIRDPRDVCISWAKHSNYSIDDSINFLCNRLSILKWLNTSKYSELPKEIFPLSLVSSWGEHVKSWTNNNMHVPKLIIKYEDLITNKEVIIRQIKDFFNENYGIKIDNYNERLVNILETTKFKYMKEYESKNGFKEAKQWSNFFRKGKAEQWKDELNKEQQSKIK